MRKFLPVLATLAAAAALAAPAHASIVLTSAPGPWTTAGFTPTTLFDFEAATPRFTGGSIVSGSASGINAAPWGDGGHYATVSPAEGTPGYFDLVGLGPIAKISFYWGSIDGYNDLYVLDANGNQLFHANGSGVVDPANGGQGDPATNRLVTLDFSGLDMTKAATLKFTSSQNAFEFDKLAILSAVPEPSTWGMMIVGLGAVGFSMRRRKVAVSFA